MIGHLRGTLRAKTPPQILVETGGIGYELDVPMSTFYPLPAVGEQVCLYTHFAVRDDGHFLYGFATDAERVAFRQLLKISGVGARTALAVLSGLTVDELAAAVLRQDTALITRVPGIGKKTAERLLLELKGKLGDSSEPNLSPPDQEQSDALHALVALGYNEREAATTLKKLPPDLTATENIRQSLKLLARL